jgi:hypothetical protein
MSQWWGQAPQGSPAAVELHRHVGLSRYLGTHPAVMRERLAQPNPFDPTRCRRKWDGNELKNGLTLLWEMFFPRIGEFRNYDIVR